MLKKYLIFTTFFIPSIFISFEWNAYAAKSLSKTPKGLDHVEHVIVLMLENRSFDHMLGLLQTTYDEKKIVPIDASGRPTHFEGIPDSLKPAFFEAEYVLNKDPGHEYDEVNRQLEGHLKADAGKLPFLDPTDFVRSAETYLKLSKHDAAKIVTSVFTPYRIPVLTTLATEYAVLDHWFASIPGPTFPNRIFVHAATSGGLVDSPDPRRLFKPAEAKKRALNSVGEFAELPVLPGAGDKPLREGRHNYDTALLTGFSFKYGPIFKQLSKAKVSWRIYHQDSLPAVLTFKSVRKELFSRKHFRYYSEFKKDLKKHAKDFPAYSFIEPDYGLIQGYKVGTSQHPMGDVRCGEAFIKDIYESLRSSELWKSSALVIIYDEHGGFYDHVRPPKAAIPDRDTRFENPNMPFKFDRLGLRVPAVVISPWIRRGTVSSKTFDHTSILKLLEKKHSMQPMTLRDSTIETFDDLFTNEFRLDTPETLPLVPDIQTLENIAMDRELQPASDDMDPLAETRELDHVIVPFIDIAASIDLEFKKSDRPMGMGKIFGNRRRDVKQVTEQISQIQTNRQARDYLREVDRKLRAQQREAEIREEEEFDRDQLKKQLKLELKKQSKMSRFLKWVGLK